VAFRPQAWQHGDAESEAAGDGSGWVALPNGGVQAEAVAGSASHPPAG